MELLFSVLEDHLKKIIKDLVAVKEKGTFQRIQVTPQHEFPLTFLYLKCP